MIAGREYGNSSDNWKPGTRLKELPDNQSGWFVHLITLRMSAVGAKRQKQAAPTKAVDRPRRSRKNLREIQPAGLWVDRDVMRRHMSATPKFVIPTESILAVHNRYLELADLALQNTEVTPVRYLPKLKRRKA